ncbi:hypothetical protein [Longitalea arenae]|uniref:hypothetical protein n=1 Tax=Longitalea arenae TaxID=2812558 RepID=UPI0019686E63|nr:hypothetical protein [Longitalea arenae]
MHEDKLETMELALKEQAEEQAKTNQLLRDQTAMIHLLRTEVSTFSEKLDNQRITVNTDTSPIQEIMKRGISNINFVAEKTLDKQRSNIWHIFFQSDAKKWAVILVVAITFLTYLYLFCSNWLRR